MNLNRAMIIGNLTRDPELKTTATGKTVARLGVATSNVWVNDAGVKQEDVEFHNVVAWGKLAEICGQYLAKGRKVYVEGRLKTRDWVGQDGVKRNRTEIIAENLIMLDKGQNQGQGGAAYAPKPIAPVATPAAAPSNGSEEEIKLEDIPF
ncbi:MAG: Single-stranded DNA-binding protein [Candidatus Magasanikbacteria bacterium GW2011_GWC2_40_17]|uniref:Single-stranded DNA-binding protein n=1 Tax=Candidatus Magasanikbacteria bacterium GW2011_GWA2_42_32 TaxID=1619039 RepID=A0A0G1A645_9BACT|nr:MAG: Single-stranded DNA-binding protein [Candidatus Magasanikbacteria bacterium GW2011_GWC2_40_17]KKS56394.1 MAG: Single-stranded DNA-binding protein [Candidatus Magasanikbacteria bacterium GW2011_GWA2_42_32]